MVLFFSIFSFIDRLEASALLLREQHIGENISNPYVKKIIKIRQQFRSLVVGFFKISRYLSIIRVSQCTATNRWQSRQHLLLQKTSKGLTALNFAADTYTWFRNEAFYYTTISLVIILFEKVTFSFLVKSILLKLYKDFKE